MELNIGGIRIGPNGVSLPGVNVNTPAGNVRVNPQEILQNILKEPHYTLKANEASPLAGNIEQFMKANGMPVNENGTISAIEMSNFKKKLDEVAKSSPEITKHVTLDREGNVLFTKKGLEMLDIQAPGAAQQQAPGQQQAPQQQPSGLAPTTQVPAAVQGAGNAISGAIGGFLRNAQQAAGQALDAGRALHEQATKCNNDQHPDFNTQACVDTRAKQADKAPQR